MTSIPWVMGGKPTSRRWSRPSACSSPVRRFRCEKVSTSRSIASATSSFAVAYIVLAISAVFDLVSFASQGADDPPTRRQNGSSWRSPGSRPTPRLIQRSRDLLVGAWVRAAGGRQPRRSGRCPGRADQRAPPARHDRGMVTGMATVTVGASSAMDLGLRGPVPARTAGRSGCPALDHLSGFCAGRERSESSPSALGQSGSPIRGSLSL